MVLVTCFYWPVTKLVWSLDLMRGCIKWHCLFFLTLHFFYSYTLSWPFFRITFNFIYLPTQLLVFYNRIQKLIFITSLECQKERGKCLLLEKGSHSMEIRETNEDIAREYGMSRSTISTIWKDKIKSLFENEAIEIFTT